MLTHSAPKFTLTKVHSKFKQFQRINYKSKKKNNNLNAYPLLKVIPLICRQCTVLFLFAAE